MLAPVVVNPDTVSKKASIYEGICPLITKGSAPIAEIISHDRAVITKPSLALYVPDGFLIDIRLPNTRNIAAGIKNEIISLYSLYIIAVIMGKAMRIEETAIIFPVKYSILLIFKSYSVPSRNHRLIQEYRQEN